MVDRVDSPWYDSVKIYRQEDYEDWSSLLFKLKANLQMPIIRRVEEISIYPEYENHSAFLLSLE